MIVFNIFLWICGLARTLAWDYAPGVPQGEEAQKRVSWKEKPIGSLVCRYLLARNPPPQPPAILAPQEEVGDVPESIEKGEKSTSTQVTVSSQPDCGPTVLPVHVRPASSSTVSSLTPRFPQFRRTLLLVFEPLNIVIAGSLCIALVQPLKALFVDVSSEGGPAWKGPDGRPPLAFIMDAGLSTSLVMVKRVPLIFFFANSCFHRRHHNPALSCALRFLLRKDENPTTDLSSPDTRNRLRLHRKAGIATGHRRLHRAGHGQAWVYPATE